MTATPDHERPQAEHTQAGHERTTHDEQTPSTEDDGQTPSDDALEEPSTEKSPAEEPKAPARDEPEPSHQAVGIGVIGGPLVDPEHPAEDTEA